MMREIENRKNFFQKMYQHEKKKHPVVKGILIGIIATVFVAVIVFVVMLTIYMNIMFWNTAPVTIPRFVLKNLEGVWFEVASVPHSNLSGVLMIPNWLEGVQTNTNIKFTFTKENKFEVIRTTTKSDGAKDSSIGTLMNTTKIFGQKQEGGDVLFTTSGKMKITYNGVLWFSYWILHMDNNFVLVGNPSRTWITILSRKSKVKVEEYSNLIELGRSLNYDMDLLTTIKHQ